jgi:hypothetical protein
MKVGLALLRALPPVSCLFDGPQTGRAPAPAFPGQDREQLLRDLRDKCSWFGVLLRRDLISGEMRWRLGLAEGQSKYDDLEKRLAEAPVINAHSHP